MTIDEVIEKLGQIRDQHNGEITVEVRNGAGDHGDLDDIRLFEGVVYMES